MVAPRRPFPKHSSSDGRAEEVLEAESLFATDQSQGVPQPHSAAGDGL